MTPKEIVLQFYNSDLANSTEVIDTCFDKNCQLHWHSSKGFNILDFNTFKAVFNEIRENYDALRFEFSHILQEGNSVTVRYTSYACTIENPNEEHALAHFTSIWEVKNGKIIKGYQMSQLADDSAASLNSF